MMGLPFMPPLQIGMIRHLTKTRSPFLARRRHSTSTIAAVRDACLTRRACAQLFTHDRSIIGGTYVNTRFARLNARRFTSVASAGAGKAPVETSSEMQEAARKHREIQNLLRQGPPAASAQPAQSSPPSLSSLAGKESESAFLYQLREQQREQKKRQAIINSVLSFLMVVLAAQGAKNGQERRNAQAGRDQAEQELLRVRDDLRKVIDSDERLGQLARECIDAFDDANLQNEGRAWRRGWMFAMWSNQPSNEGHEARVHRVVKALRQGLESQMTAVLLSDEEKERQEMEQLANFASSALSFPDATTPNTTSSGVKSLPSSSLPPEEASTTTAHGPIDHHAVVVPNTDGSTAPKKVFMF